MITEDSRVVLIRSCQNQVKVAKEKYKRGIIDLKTLQEINKAMKSVIIQIQIQANRDV